MSRRRRSFNSRPQQRLRPTPPEISLSRPPATMAQPTDAPPPATATQVLASTPVAAATDVPPTAPPTAEPAATDTQPAVAQAHPDADIGHHIAAAVTASSDVYAGAGSYGNPGR